MAAPKKRGAVTSVLGAPIKESREDAGRLTSTVRKVGSKEL